MLLVIDSADASTNHASISSKLPKNLIGDDFHWHKVFTLVLNSLRMSAQTR